MESISKAYLAITIPYMAIPYIAIPYMAIPYMAIPYMAIPYMAIPYMSIPYMAIPLYGYTSAYLKHQFLIVLLQYGLCTFSILFLLKKYGKVWGLVDRGSGDW